MSLGEWCHKVVFIAKIVKINCFIVLDICLALTTAQDKNMAFALSITLVRTSLRATLVPICDVIHGCLLNDC